MGDNNTDKEKQEQEKLEQEKQQQEATAPKDLKGIIAAQLSDIDTTDQVKVIAALDESFKIWREQNDNKPTYEEFKTKLAEEAASGPLKKALDDSKLNLNSALDNGIAFLQDQAQHLERGDLNEHQSKRLATGLFTDAVSAALDKDPTVKAEYLTILKSQFKDIINDEVQKGTGQYKDYVASLGKFLPDMANSIDGLIKASAATEVDKFLLAQSDPEKFVGIIRNKMEQEFAKSDQYAGMDMAGHQIKISDTKEIIRGQLGFKKPENDVETALQDAQMNLFALDVTYVQGKTGGKYTAQEVAMTVAAYHNIHDGNDANNAMMVSNGITGYFTGEKMYNKNLMAQLENESLKLPFDLNSVTADNKALHAAGLAIKPEDGSAITDTDELKKIQEENWKTSKQRRDESLAAQAFKEIAEGNIAGGLAMLLIAYFQDPKETQGIMAEKIGPLKDVFDHFMSGEKKEEKEEVAKKEERTPLTPEQTEIAEKEIGTLRDSRLTAETGGTPFKSEDQLREERGLPASTADGWMRAFRGFTGLTPDNSLAANANASFSNAKYEEASVAQLFDRIKAPNTPDVSRQNVINGPTV